MSNPRTEAVDYDTRSGEINKKVDEELGRDEELSEDEDIEDCLIKLFTDVEKGFNAQAERSDELDSYWDLYNCKLSEKQFYNGNSAIFVPIVQNAVKARKTRFVNQLFPQSGRYVEVTTANGDVPAGEVALLESYVRKAKMRTQIMPALMKNGDVEGQYTVALSWTRHCRNVVYRKSSAPVVEGIPMPDEESDVEDIVAEEITTGRPHVEVIADADFLVLPQTSDSLMDALNAGGSVTIIRRWTKARIEAAKKEGLITEDGAEYLLEEMSKKNDQMDKPKKMVDAAGINQDGRGKFAQVYETWTMLTIPVKKKGQKGKKKKERRLCRAFWGGSKQVLGCKRNPYWSDRLPIFSCPVDKVQGSFKGVSMLQAVADLQYQANDAVNEAMDSAAYALMPIVMTDPEKNPRVGSMILSLAAVWQTSPNDTKFVQFPALWKEGLEIVAAARQEIFQTLSVNPAQITNAAGNKKKPSQAEVANEQQIDILTTADAVTVLEDEILTPLVTFMLELDHQFRDDEILVREYGEMGVRATIQRVPPISMEKAYHFRWYGVEAARNAQQMQIQVQTINVIKGIPPQFYEGYRLDLGPAIAQLVENVFGPRLAPLTFKSLQEEVGLDPTMENTLLLAGHICPVHLGDDHQKHLQVHQQAAMQDRTGHVKVHMQAHLQALEKKQMEQQAKMMKAKGMGGPPGGQPGQPPPGGPRQGAAPGLPRGAQRPPGAIHQDRLQDPSKMPQ